MLRSLIVCISVFVFCHAQNYNLHSPQDLELFLKHTFERLDDNGNGILEIHEFAGVFLAEDLNGDGFLSLTEYEQALPVKHELSAQAFYYLDTDGNGLIPMNDMSRFFMAMDADRNGYIDVSEYIQYEKITMGKIYGHKVDALLGNTL